MGNNDVKIEGNIEGVGVVTGGVVYQTFNKIPKSIRWIIGIGAISSFAYYGVSLSQTNEIVKSSERQEQNLQSINEKLDSLMIYGDKTKFLKEYFGDDWRKVLENPQTYNNLKLKLINSKSDTEKLLQERKELIQNMQSLKLNDSLKKKVDKAFIELRYDDVRDFIDNFIKKESKKYILEEEGNKTTYADSQISDENKKGLIFTISSEANINPKSNEISEINNIKNLEIGIKKRALLIGNNDYSFQPLTTSLNNIESISKTLTDMDFNVTILENASKSEIEKALRQIHKETTPSTISLIYFSGHILQINDTNYIIPTSITPENRVDLLGLVNLNYFLESLRYAKCGIILIDASSSNSLIKYFQNNGRKGVVSKEGLAKITPLKEQIIGFSGINENSEEQEKDVSLYALSLSTQLKEYGDIHNIFSRVSKEVNTISLGEQHPLTISNIDSSIYLKDLSVFEQNVTILQEEKATKK